MANPLPLEDTFLSNQTKYCISFWSIPSLPPQAFGQAYSNQRKVAEDGEINEESLLQESASKEAFYMGQLLELQMDLKMSRSVASNASNESERLNAVLQEHKEVETFVH